MTEMKKYKPHNLSVVDISDDQLTAYWADYFGVTEKLLKETIAIVGNSIESVEGHINKIIIYYTHIYTI